MPRLFSIKQCVFALVASAGLASPAFALTSADFPFNPKYFNVYSGGDIGTSGTGYGSDFEGIAGVKGSFYVSGFSLHDIAAAGPGTGVSLYAGGDAVISGQINNGGIEAGGNVAINGTGVNGFVHAGGNLLGTSGNITGNVTLGGVKLAGGSVTVGGTLTTGIPYSAPVDLAKVDSYFTEVSSAFAALAPTTSPVNNWGELVITAVSGTNVVNISAADLEAAWGVTINGPADAVVIINVLDAGSLSIASPVFALNGVPRENVLVNVANATSLALSSGNWVSILAINTNVHFSSGLVVGNLITNNLTGSGQVNTGFFNFYDLGGSTPPPPKDTDTPPPTGATPATPEPATAALGLLAFGATTLLARRRSRA